MSHRSRVRTVATRSLRAALLATLTFAAPALAQSVRDKPLTENPSRTPGGSCIYDGDGKLLFAPRGATCPETESPPASAAPEAAPSQREQPPGAQGAPPLPARQEVAALLAERERLDVELARVREAVAYEDRESARRVVDESLRKITRHLEHEARVLQPLAKAP